MFGLKRFRSSEEKTFVKESMRLLYDSATKSNDLPIYPKNGMSFFRYDDTDTVKGILHLLNKQEDNPNFLNYLFQRPYMRVGRDLRVKVFLGWLAIPMGDDMEVRSGWLPKPTKGFDPRIHLCNYNMYEFEGSYKTPIAFCYHEVDLGVLTSDVVLTLDKISADRENHFENGNKLDYLRINDGVSTKKLIDCDLYPILV